MRRVSDFVTAMTEKEPNLPLLTIVAFIVGVLVYFNLSFEPSLAKLTVPFCVLGIVSILPVFRVIRLFLLIPLFFVFGLIVCTIHTMNTDTMFLPYPVERVYVTGEVLSAMGGLNNTQVVVTLKSVQKEHSGYKKDVFSANDLPQKARLIIVDEISELQKGDVVSGFVYLLSPPSLPITPFGYNEARTFFYEGIGAKGVLQYPVVQKGKQPEQSCFETIISSAERMIRQKINQNIEFENQGIAEALVLGNTRYVTTSSKLLYRDLGLSHILSVSGFHIGLIAFLVFGFIRLGLSLLPEIFSAVWIKRIAVLFALVISGFYVFLSGAHPPAIRAFIMVGGALIAVFFDKRALSIRSLFVAAFLILCYEPVLLMSVSFQLSFIAVLCLVGICSVGKKFLQKRSVSVKIIFSILLFCFFNFCVTVVTAPFVAYAFHQLPLYAVLGNLLLSSVFAWAIIPILFGAVVFIATPIADWLFYGVDILLNFVRWVGMPITLWPNASIYVPYFEAWGLVVWTFGLIGFVLFYGKIRWLFLGGMFLFLMAFYDIEKPTALIGDGGQFISVKQGKIYYETESLYHRQLHQALLGYVDFDKYRIKPISLLSSSVVGFDENTCQDALFSVQRNKQMNLCPRLITPQQIRRWQTVLLYLKSDDSFKIKLGCETDKDRPWGCVCPVFSYKNFF